MKRSIEFLNECFKNGDVVVVACSGGPDSMCLLHLVNKVREEKKLKVIVAHVNHNLRDESVSELEFVKRYSLDNNDIFEEYTILKDKKYSESDFRNFRYDFFRDIIKKYNANYLLTAHHGDDLIETVMMRIVRGSNLNGYSGIKKYVDKGFYKVLRPLIFYSKDEILDYNTANNIKFVNDYTNDLDDYTRNRYRHKLLPFLKSEEKKVHNKFLKYSEELQECEDFIESVIDKYRLDVICENKINVSKFKALDNFVQKRLIIGLLKNVYQTMLYYVNDKNIKEIIRIICNNNSKNIIFDLPLEYNGVVSYGWFYIKKKSVLNSYKLELKDELKLSNGDNIKVVSHSDEKSNYVIRLNKSEVKFPLYIRSRLDGDFLEVKGLNGKKKVKDIFIDEKISKENRASWPILVDTNNTVLWVLGIKKSKFDKEKTEMYDIIIKYEKEKMYE